MRKQLISPRESKKQEALRILEAREKQTIWDAFNSCVITHDIKRSEPWLDRRIYAPNTWVCYLYSCRNQPAVDTFWVKVIRFGFGDAESKDENYLVGRFWEAFHEFEQEIEERRASIARDGDLIPDDCRFKPAATPHR